MYRSNFLRNSASTTRRKPAKARRNQQTKSRRARSWGLFPERLEDRLLLTIFTVSNTSNDSSVNGSLPFEVAQANANTGDEAVIEFADAAGQTFATHQTITLKATLTLDHSSAPKDPISIVGPTAGLTIAGGGSGSDFSVITVTSDTQQAAIKGDSASGPITITDGKLTSSSESGAGIDDLGDLVLENVAITDNTSAGSGGGVEVVGAPDFSGNPGAALLASDTTFTGNKAAVNGGGVDMEGTAALIVNSTFSGNTAGTNGGAIENGPTNLVSGFLGINLGVVNDTISGNTATVFGGGIDNGNTGILGILNAVVAGNTVAAGGSGADVDSGGSAGIYSGSSHDVIGSADGLQGTTITDGSNGNVVGHPALLASLGDYGGANASGAVSTGNGDLQTFALLPGSPAINDALVLANLTADATSTTTTIQAGTQLPIPSISGSTFPYEQGKVILIGSEQMLVTGVSGSAQSGFTLTVTRGVNGTTAAAHSKNDPIFLPDERGVFAASNAIGSFQTQGFKVSAKSGDTPQSTAASSAFANALGVTVTANDPNGVVNGGVITYTAPTSGASATLSGGTATIASGAASVSATANAAVGSYTVGATAGYGTDATFSLTNTVAAATISATISAIAAIAATEGATANLAATFTDSNPAENAASDFTATINWGDSTSSTGTVKTASDGGFSVTGTHQYAEAGTKPVVVTITDGNGAKGSATATATIADATLTPGAAATITATEGVTYSSGVGSFTDADPLAAASDFSATITWGTGTASTTSTGSVQPIAGTAGGFSVTGTHVFSDETASSPFSIVVNDVGGQHVALTGSAKVDDATLTPTPVTFGATAGVTFSGKVASFSDANTLATASDFTATIDWGDGGSTSTGNVSAASGGGFSVTGAHLYTDNTTRTVSVVIDDKGGADTTVTSTAVFTDVVASATPVKISPTEGTAFSGGVAAFQGSEAGGTTADFTASIVWGDGQTSAGAISGTAAAGYIVSGSHTYAEEAASVPLAVVIVDKAGTQDSVANPTTVADAPLSATASSTVSSTEGSTFSGTLATFTDANPKGAASDYSATIDWGDKSAPSTVSGSQITAAAGGFAVSASHVYAEEGSFTFTVTVNDVGGAHASATAVAVVADAPLSGTSASISAGTTVSGTVASFSDPDTADTTVDYSATIDWGDGKTTSGTIVAGAAAGQFNVAGTHGYTDATAHTITVTVNHGTDQPLVIHSAEPGLPVPFLVTEHTYTIGSGTVTVSAAHGLLGGDTGPSQLMVTAATVTGAQGGTFTINADGSFTYTPGTNFPGYDSAPFTVTDASGDKGTAAVNVLSQHAGVVWKFYESVLNREPDPAGLQYWTNYFNNGGQTGEMAVGFFESTELLDKIITNYYQQYLLRTPDAAGLAYWVGVWQATGGPEQIKAGFADSPEFFTSSGGTPASWLTALYQRILNRAPDPAGESFWMSYYQQQTAAGVDAGTIRDNIALGFFTAVEAYGNDVTGWFQEYLFRAPTDAEKTQYVNQMLAGATDRTIEQEITNLPEYASNPPAPPAGSAASLASYYQTSAPTQAVVAAKDALFSSM